MAGLLPLQPGYATFAALPHVSASLPRVGATQPTPHGAISVAPSDYLHGVCARHGLLALL